MFSIVRTLFAGASAKAEEEMRDRFAIPLIEQKLREAEGGLTAAKQTLAALILREQGEARALAGLAGRIADLETRVELALAANSAELARDGATTIATLENERTVRTATVAQLKQKVERLRLSVEKAHRRIADLKLGLTQARAADAAAKAGRSLDRALGGDAAIREAEALIERVISASDPFEESRVLDGIDDELNGFNVRDRLANAGFGPRIRVTADDVLARLKTEKAA